MIRAFENLKHQAKTKGNFRFTIHELRSNYLKLCILDKDWGCVILGSDTCRIKAYQAMMKNFIPVDREGTRAAKRIILKLLEDNRQASFCTKFKAAKKHPAYFFFSAKTHKESFCFVSFRKDHWASKCIKVFGATTLKNTHSGTTLDTKLGASDNLSSETREASRLWVFFRHTRYVLLFPYTSYLQVL